MAQPPAGAPSGGGLTVVLRGLDYASASALHTLEGPEKRVDAVRVEL